MVQAGNREKIREDRIGRQYPAVSHAVLSSLVFSLVLGLCHKSFVLLGYALAWKMQVQSRGYYVQESERISFKALSIHRETGNAFKHAPGA